jgi:protein TonB
MENKINYAAMSLDEIIFIGRNQSYGAYDLRRSYPEHVKRSLLGLLFFITVAIAGQRIYALWHPFTAEKKIETVVTLSDKVDVQPPIADKPKVQPPNQGKPNAATAAVATYTPANDNIPEKDTTLAPDPNLDISDHAQTGTPGETEGSEKGTALGKGVEEAPKEPQLVNWAEIMPEYPGGESVLYDFVRKHLEYPRYELETGIQGKVTVGFIIDENGKVTNVHVMKGVSRGIDNEAIRVVKLLHDFTPGSQSGRKVRVNFVLPLVFALGKE